MFKKNQISIFVIIILLIFLSFISFFLFTDKNNLNLESEIKEEINFGVEEYVKSCMEKQSKTEMKQILLSGGYHELPLIYTFDYYTPIAIYNYENQTIIPSKEEIENQLNLALNQNLNNCLKELIIFEEIYNNITINNITSKITFFPKSLTYNLNMPITLENSNGIISFENFQISQETDILNYHSIVQKFLDIHNNSFTEIPISELNFLSLEENFKYKIKQKGENIAVYSFIFQNELNEEITYQFAIQYSWEEIEE